MASLGGHWRDSAGNQTPTTSWAGLNFATEVSNDSGSLLTKPNDSTIQVGEAMAAAGGKARIFIANLKFDTSHNNRVNIQARFALTSGTGTLFTTYATGYARNTNNSELWIRVIGVLFDSSLNAQVQIQWRRSTQSPTMVTLANVSDLQCSEIWYEAAGVYRNSGSAGAMGGTTRNTVALNTTDLETDDTKIERVGNDVELKANESFYLLLGTVAGGTSGGSRTQRISNFAYDGVAKEDTQCYAYQRNSSNNLAGMAMMDLYNTDEVTVDATMQCYRGAGVTADDGGADVDGSWQATADQVQMCVMLLNGSAEMFRSTDGTGLQDIAGGVTTTMNAMRTVDFNDAASYSGGFTTAMTVNADHKMLCWANIWTARQTVSSGVRLTAGARITIGGVDQAVGEHGKYTRGNQGSQDTFGGSWNPGGVFDVSNSDTIGVEMFDSGDNGGDDRTQAGTVSFLALNLDSTEPSSGTAYTITADAGSYTLLGSAINLPVALNVSADGGSYSLTGSDINLPLAMTISADAGSYTITGNDIATLLDLTITAEGGSYAITGQDTDLVKAVEIGIDGGVYNITGADVTFIEGKTISADSGSYTVTGQDTGLTASISIIAESGSYIVTGADTGLVAGKILSAESGIYNITGSAINLPIDRIAGVEAGIYALTGSDANLISNTGALLIADAGAYIVSGSDVGLNPAITYDIAAEGGAYSLTGEDIVLDYTPSPATGGTWHHRRRRRWSRTK